MRRRRSGYNEACRILVLRHARRQEQDWFDDEDAAINTLLAEMNWLPKAYTSRPNDAKKAAFYRSRRLVQHRLHEMQNAWMSREAEEIQGADETTQLTEKTKILKRWDKDFRRLLNRPSTISNAVIDRLHQVETKPQHRSLALCPRNHQGRAATLQRESTQIRHEPCQGLQNQQLCDNHRGIWLLNIAAKIFTRILLNHLNSHLEQGLLPESQCSFNRYHGTIDMLFAVCQLREKCQAIWEPRRSSLSAVVFLFVLDHSEPSLTSGLLASVLTSDHDGGVEQTVRQMQLFLFVLDHSAPSLTSGLLASVLKPGPGPAVEHTVDSVETDGQTVIVVLTQRIIVIKLHTFLTKILKICHDSSRRICKLSSRATFISPSEMKGRKILRRLKPLPRPPTPRLPAGTVSPPPAILGCVHVPTTDRGMGATQEAIQLGGLECLSAFVFHAHIPPNWPES
ncbi:unnamed protein product [Schistocephalus solidus]|uniref:Reverse transcriptase domain-containing protein n=1 Tax=Schistocephalus solidus TaxID=70667 RepID=A0A183SGJ5_SCHSO|nr:unnamed protein product [Schistocephalus solidus]